MLVAIPILLFSPLLLLTTLSEKTYNQFYWLARNIWAKTILFGMGCPPKIQWDQELIREKGYMLVANHSSMLDIMLMLYVSKNPFVFVGKQELAKIPVFGFFYRRACILVDRSDPKSRSAVYRRAKRRLEKGLSICIFPEGGIPEEHIVLDKFKDGAFRMAIIYNIPIVPMTFLDCKKRFPWKFFSGSPGKLRVKVHSFVETGILGTADSGTIKNEIRKLLLGTLLDDDQKKPYDTRKS
ncbi:1-acyl-sn-glycerol-3-phosphate acyltransferase [Muricauda sp. SCSIO 64092]|uniref:lysophospholipid acyltransferase family protein n=1 Tax=Allomuricauda sp. SCSIO 64092 TaxID=2908842 RepID=UPI001FF62CC3|nr:lysophospholipid acyltransferase family protein [Muricauda sp. SCSIO 64092]UOY08773.1 1-acyl-sn-glycerol-3-phosphate acyltransferase [Muricauda sp. SCSIO 64092]